VKEIRDELDQVPPELRRRMVPQIRGGDPIIERDGRILINFTANNYLSLATHPEIIEAAARAAREDGAGAGSSRLITGTSPRLARLEEELARLKETERAIVTTSGFTAALAGITALVGQNDGVALERGAHASLVSGARLSGAALAVFRRDDPASLETALRRLRREARRVLVIIDGIHSMDGDIAPLPLMMRVIEAYEAILFVDDAHATGVIGQGGAGTLSHFGIKPAERVIQMGTLSKALGSQGGFLAAAGSVIDAVIQRAGAFIYTTGLNPPAVGAALAAVELLEKDPPRLERLRANSLSLRQALGMDAAPSPILPLILRESAAAVEASREVESAGALALAIRPPTVPRDTARLRISVQADHDLKLESDPEWLVCLKRYCRVRARP
jgi:8-amino-7-oxononanoate synthase